MKTADPNVVAVDAVAAVLEPLLDELVLVGGCAVSFLLTDPAAPQVRPTLDVDFVVELSGRRSLRRLERELERCGAAPDLSDEAPICRWTVGSRIVDIMPSDATLFGFTNQWMAAASRGAKRFPLPSGRQVSVVAAPVLLAMKLDAFGSRGSENAYSSRDLEDIVALLDGRPELVTEAGASDPELRAFIRAAVRQILGRADLDGLIAAHLYPDPGSQARVPILLQRLRALDS